jgi:hypothetical protein
VGRANVGGFRLDVRVEDRAVRRALTSMRKYASRDAKEATRAAVERELPRIRRGVPLGDSRKGHIRDKIVARARAGGYPYLTALGRHKGHLGVLEFGGTRRDVVRSRDGRRVLWSGERRHPRTQYVTQSVRRNTPMLRSEIEDILTGILQEYIRAAGTFRGRAG